jgi:hypothetical protein
VHALLALLPLALAPSPAPQGATPWPLAREGWRTDPAWGDGKAEKCVYDATREVYGAERRYLATAYTNKQRMDPATGVKAAGAEAGPNDGVEVFKHHWAERVPTEAYDYDFSTAVFVRTADLAPFKLTAATQEDCGASFKQCWRRGERLAWLDSVYHPGAGLRQGEIDAAGVHFADGLALLLRDFPFDSPPEAPLPIALVASQKDPRQVPFVPRDFRLAHRGRERVDVPLGAVEAHRIDLETPEGERVASYWLAAEGAAPWLHALVAYEGSGGVSYRLRSIERTAYWERG